MPAPTTGKPGSMSGPPPGYHQGPPYGGQPHFQQPPYGGPPPPGGHMPPNGGYMGWQGQQQPQQPPPYGGGPGAGWPQGQGAPPMGMYRQGGPPPTGMDRGNWNGYRGGPPPPPPPTQQGRRPPQDMSPPRQKGGKQESPYWGQQWPQHQWGGGPPPPHAWQQGGPAPMQQPGQSPPPSMPQHMQGPPPKMWSGGGRDLSSPVRPPRRSPDSMSTGMMTGYPSSRMNGMDPMSKSVGIGMDDGDDMYMTREEKKNRAELEKEKGRGSYRCGRCGAPKKGHVCPYQPKLKRRPDEPPPEMRNAALQVEMDEFMTLRRLNIEIQGFPESYATAPLLTDNMVVGEPHPLALTAGVVTNLVTGETTSGPSASSPPSTPEMMRSSPGPSPILEAGV